MTWSTYASSTTSTTRPRLLACSFCVLLMILFAVYNINSRPALFGKLQRMKWISVTKHLNASGHQRIKSLQRLGSSPSHRSSTKPIHGKDLPSSKGVDGESKSTTELLQPNVKGTGQSNIEETEVSENKGKKLEVANEESTSAMRVKSDNWPGFETSRKEEMELHDVNNTDEYQIERLHNRIRRLEQICPNYERQLAKNNTTDERLDRLYWRLYQNNEHKLVYCQTEKVGSSFWKRIFKVLDASNTKDQHLFDMSSMSAHDDIPPSMKLSLTETEEVLRTYTKFMFTRDPFARLFSAYVDKVMVPNALGFVLSKRVSQWKGDPTGNCGYYIDFTDFCGYIASTILSSEELDAHFAPVYTGCDPCLLNFTFIGKMETFLEDTKAILTAVGIPLSRVLGNITDVESANEIGIVRDMVYRTFEHMSSQYAGCTPNITSLHRLWRVFHIRGFISKNIHFPEKLNDIKGEIEMNQFTEAAISAYNRSEGRMFRLRQREESMMEAYASLPSDILKNLTSAFAIDCSLFDYFCDATERFSRNVGSLNYSYFTI